MNLELARKIVPHPCSAATFAIVPFLFRSLSANPSKSSGVNGMRRCMLFRSLLQTQSRTDGTHRPPYRGPCSATARAGLPFQSACGAIGTGAAGICRLPNYQPRFHVRSSSCIAAAEPRRNVRGFLLSIAARRATGSRTRASRRLS